VPNSVISDWCSRNAEASSTSARVRLAQSRGEVVDALLFVRQSWTKGHDDLERGQSHAFLGMNMGETSAQSSGRLPGGCMALPEVLSKQQDDSAKTIETE
jgi:hypothetical protein